ncbi:hypothetical protein NRA10_17485 [Acinetobacter baumannii]|nr:hypothetical protein [Acinetobacter baumannii]MDC5043964.1 hypothetical protein [Acinetobacter baumannii]
MKMKFIAYNPNFGKKIRLVEHTHQEREDFSKLYYTDEHGNFVLDFATKLIFDPNKYESNMMVEIEKQPYYLIGEY